MAIAYSSDVPKKIFPRWSEGMDGKRCLSIGTIQMNHNTSEPKKVITHAYHANGMMKLGLRNTDTSTYAPKTPRNEQKEYSVRGKRGLTKKDRQNIENGLFVLKNLFGVDSLRWLVLPYPDKSEGAIVSIAEGMNELIKRAKRRLNKTYKTNWALSIGLRKLTSYSKLLPLYDINIAIVDRGDKVAEYLIDDIYKNLSDVGGTVIEPCAYYRHLTNTDENFRQFTNYFTDQIETRLLERLREIHPHDYFPKTWGFIPSDLKAMSQPFKNEFSGDNLQWWETTIKDNLKGLVKMLSKYSNKQKIVAQIDLSKKTPEEIQQICKELWNAQYNKI